MGAKLYSIHLVFYNIQLLQEDYYAELHNTCIHRDSYETLRGTSSALVHPPRGCRRRTGFLKPRLRIMSLVSYTHTYIHTHT